MKKKLFIKNILLTSLAVVSLSGCSESVKDIVIIYTNDVHCGIDDHIGYAGIKAYKDELIKAGHSTLLVDIGDQVEGGLYGLLDEGESMIKLMNECGYDISTVGNHEFDYGIEQFNKNVNSSNFPYVCCNYYEVGKDTPILDPYKIFDIDGAKIAFLGITTPTVLSEGTPSNFQNSDGEFIYDFKQGEQGELLYSTVQSYVNKIKEEGANYIIALSHLGEADAEAPYRSTDVAEHTTGIDVFLDGHSHKVTDFKVKNKDDKDVIISQTGTKIENIGKLTISSNGKIKAELINDYTKKDKDVEKTINEIKEKVESLTTEVIGHSNYDLTINNNDKRAIRNEETNLGDLVTDAIRNAANSDVAIINGGAIRESITKGDITIGNILTTLPFINYIAKIEITGQDIADFLEYSSYVCPSEFGGFLQVSNINFTIDTNIATPVTIDEYTGSFNPLTNDTIRRVKDIKIGNKDINLKGYYTLASNDYIALCGGNGYPNHIKDQMDVKDMMVYESLVNYIKDDLNGEISEQYSNLSGEGRINII